MNEWKKYLIGGTEDNFAEPAENKPEEDNFAEPAEDKPKTSMQIYLMGGVPDNESESPLMESVSATDQPLNLATANALEAFTHPLKREVKIARNLLLANMGLRIGEEISQGVDEYLNGNIPQAEPRKTTKERVDAAREKGKRAKIVSKKIIGAFGEFARKRKAAKENKQEKDGGQQPEVVELHQQEDGTYSRGEK